MATINENYAYTYDPTGKLPDNLIKNERHDVQPPSGIEDASLFFLRAAPAFEESIVLRKGPTDASPLLVKGQDYILTHKFLWKSWELTKPIYGSVTMINRNYTGEVYVSYQSLGGAYVVDDQTYLERLARDIYRSRYVYWEQVSKNLPGLPPFDHTMSGTDTIGWDQVVDSILRLVAAIYDTANGGTGGGGGGDGSASLNQHINSTTAHQLKNVGGSNLFNYPMATDSDFENEALNKYTNPAVIALWVRRYITSLGLGTVSNDLTQLRLKVNDIESRTNGLRDDVNAQKLLMDELGDAIDELKRRQDETETTVADAVADIPVIKDDIASIKRQLSGEDDTGLGNRVATLEATNTLHTTEIGNLKEKDIETDSRLTALETGTGGGGGTDPDVELRLATVEAKQITHDNDIIALKKVNTTNAQGFSDNQLTFFGESGKEYTLKPNDSIQIEYVTPGRFSDNTLYLVGTGAAKPPHQIEVWLHFEDNTRQRILLATDNLYDAGGDTIDDKHLDFVDPLLGLFERTVGTVPNSVNGQTGKILQSIEFGKGMKTWDDTKKGTGNGTYYKLQYTNVTVKTVKISLVAKDIPFYLTDVLPALNVTDLDDLTPYLRGLPGYLITVTRGA